MTVSNIKPKEKKCKGSNQKTGLSLHSLVAIFAGGNLFSTLLRMAGGIFTAKIILPNELGLFNGIGLVLGYLPIPKLSEGINSKIQTNARGFRNLENYRTSILFFCGKLNIAPQKLT